MRSLKVALSGAALVVFLAGCSGNAPRQESQPATAAPEARVVSTASAGTIRVQQRVPFADNGRNDQAVQRECRIDSQLPQFIQEQASRQGVQVEMVSNVAADAPGRNLVITFEQTRSSGNAFTGHYKYTQIKAVLYEDGKEVADLTAGRRSGGGAFAGYKGSCSVMGRTVRTLGSDVAGWLRQPVPGARRGDL